MKIKPTPKTMESVEYDIPDETTARELLAWLCPKE